MSRIECPPPWWRGFNSAADLRNLRKLAGMSQAELGALAGFNRHTIIYHEKRIGRIDGVAPRRFREAFEHLGINVPGWREAPVPMPFKKPRHRPRVDGKCGAKTRKGTPCECQALANGRCKFHGGASTGPKTAEGKARILEARRYRAERERVRRSQPGAFVHQYAQARARAT